MKDVASFDISFKILAAIQLPFETLSMVIFPTIARTQNLQLNQKFIFYSFAISLILWAITYWQADFLITLLGGEELLAYSPLLQTMSVMIPIVVLTYFLGTNTLVAFGYQNQFNYSFIFPSIIYILILLYLWKMNLLTFELIVYSRIFVELLMVLYRLFVAIKYKLIFISR
jgi:PST family polysaccharide transporter